MGCCLSTKKSSPPSNQKTHHYSNTRTFDTPLMEEERETVKEVLSETHSLKHTIAIARLEEEVMKSENESSQGLVAPEEVSEVSGICSVSDNESTVSVLEKKVDDDDDGDDGDGDGEVRQMQRLDRSPAKFTRNRSYSGDSPLKRERVVGRSPVRITDPLPVRRNGGSQISTTIRRSGSSNNSSSHRSYSRQNSNRRSKSPVKCTDSGKSLSRSSSASRRVVTKPPPEKNEKVKETSETSKWAPLNESLENPLVSLECFIFL